MLHESISARTLALLRIGVFGLCAVRFALADHASLASIPRELFEPAGLLRLLPRALWNALLSAPAIWTAKAAVGTGLLLCIVGAPGYRAIAVASTLGLVAFQGLAPSFGVVSHDGLAPLFVAALLALAPATEAFALARPKRRAAVEARRAAVLGGAFVLVLLYAMIGLRRLGAAPGIFLDGTIVHHLVARSLQQGAFARLGLWAQAVPALGAAAAAAYALTTLFEVLAPLCLFSRGFRRTWLVVILGFHLGSWLAMGIAFPNHVLLCSVLLVDVERLTGRLGRYGSENSGSRFSRFARTASR